MVIIFPFESPRRGQALFPGFRSHGRRVGNHSGPRGAGSRLKMSSDGFALPGAARVAHTDIRCPIVVSIPTLSPRICVLLYLVLVFARALRLDANIHDARVGLVRLSSCWHLVGVHMVGLRVASLLELFDPRTLARSLSYRGRHQASLLPPREGFTIWLTKLSPEWVFFSTRTKAPQAGFVPFIGPQGAGCGPYRSDFCLSFPSELRFDVELRSAPPPMRAMWSRGHMR